MRWLPGLVVALAILAGGTWWLTRGGDRSDGAAGARAADARGSAEAPAAQRPPAPSAVEAGAEPAPPQAAEDRAGERREDRFAGIAAAGRVVDGDGRPVAGARLSWTALPAGPDYVDWRRLDREADPRRSAWAESDAEGRFRFPRPPSGVDPASPEGPPSAVWATRPGSRAACHLLEPGAERDAFALELVLIAADPVRARVVDDDGGRPRAGARVVQRGVVAARAPGTPAEARPEWERRAHAVFAREAVTDDGGRVELGAVGGAQVLFAQLDDERSRPWLGFEPTEVELVLRSTFTVEGRVVAPGAESFPAVRVDVSANTGADLDSFARLGVRAESATTGRYGPVELERIGGDAFVAVAYDAGGGDRIAGWATFERPAAGGSVSLEHVLEPGVPLAAQTVDSSGRPVAGAWVYAGWDAGQAIGQSHEVTSDAEGRALVRGVRPGLVWVMALHEDYAPASVSGVEAPLADDEPVRLVLAGSGRLEGRVTHRGQPLDSFEVSVWAGSMDTLQTYGFRDAGGSFSIEPVPEGRVSVVAFSSSLPRSETVVAEVPPDGTGEVEIELALPLPGGGTVVDAVTGQAVPDAVVQVYTNAGEQLLVPWGEPVPVDPGGEFRVDAFAPGTSSVIVSAPGYADRIALAQATRGGEADFGVVPLDRPRTVDVQLVGRPEAGGWSDYRLSASGASQATAPPFDADGRTLLTDLVSGEYRFRLDGPGDEAMTARVLLLGGASSRLELPVGTEREVAVQLVGSEEQPIPVGGWVSYSFSGARPETFTHWVRVPAGGRTSSRRVLGSACVVEVYDGARERLASRRYALGADPQPSFELALGGRAARLRLVDVEGRPLPDATLWVQVRGDESGWMETLVTDADGLARTGLVPSSELQVSARLLSGAQQPVVPVDLAGDPDEVVEIVFRADAGLRLAFADGDVPIAGMRVLVTDPTGAFNVAVANSDAEGRLSVDGVAEGELRVVASHASVWPVEVSVEATTDPALQRIAVRRLADLELRARTEGGLPVPGLAVALRSVEYDASVADWIAQGRVVAESGLVTDGRGNVRLTGLPRGPYAWSVAGPGGATQAGTVELRAGELTRLDLRP